MKFNKFKFSVLIPSYNGELVIGNAIESVLRQDYTNFEIIINDDASNDKTIDLVRRLNNKKIKLFINKKNLGYPGNLNACLSHAKGEIIYLLGQDDILSSDALSSTNKAFNISKNIGAVTRPYRWFDDNFSRTIRLKHGLNTGKNEVISINDSKERVANVFRTLDSLTALAYRKKFLDRPFHPDIFPCHIYPFASIFKKHPIVFLNSYVSSVSVKVSQTLFVSSIYDKSPLLSWVQMFDKIFPEKKFDDMRNFCVRHFIAANYVGLAQIKNYSRHPYLYTLREIFYLLRYNPFNLLKPQFLLFSIGALVVPRFVLIRLINIYKKWFNTKIFKNITFKHEFSRKELARF